MNQRDGSVLRNEFSWSWSRHQTFHTCLRRYWLTHYASWGGWDPSASAEVREIYIQKHLCSRPQWIGLLVHDAARFVLQQVRDGRRPHPERIVDQFRRLAHRQVRDSEVGRHRYFPKKYVGFLEHYYEEPVDPEIWSDAIDEITRQVGGLFEDPVFLRLTEVPERIREVERLEQLRVGDVPVWVSLDVLVADGRGGLVVVDWKTGAAPIAEAITSQLGIYALYVLRRYLRARGSSPTPRDLARVKTMYVNLRSGVREVRELRRDHVEQATALVRSSAEAMRARLEHVGDNLADPERFPRLPAGSAACTTCAFRRTCGREATKK